MIKTRVIKGCMGILIILYSMVASYAAVYEGNHPPEEYSPITLQLQENASDLSGEVSHEGGAGGTTTQSAQAPFQTVQPIPANPISAGASIEPPPLSSNGFLGQILLNRVYEADEVLQRYRRKQVRLGVLSVPIIIGIAGTGLVQNIINLDILNEPPPQLGDQRTVAVLGVVGTSVALASFGGFSYLYLRYNKRIEARKAELRAVVDALLQRLQATQNPDLVRPELSRLIGPEAAQDFLYLWRKNYQNQQEISRKDTNIDSTMEGIHYISGYLK